MSGPLSDETMAEIREWLVNDQPSVQADVYASLLLAEWDRLRAEPRLWHSETQGYVRVLALGYVAVSPIGDAIGVMVEYDLLGTQLYPTLESLAETLELEPGWEPGVVLPLSAFGGAT